MTHRVRHGLLVLYLGSIATACGSSSSDSSMQAPTTTVVVRFASLDAAQTAPAVTSTAVGAGILTVDGATGNAIGFITTTGLTATLAHVHQAPRGTPGSVILPLAGGPNVWVSADGASAMSAARVADFGAGTRYFNARTAAFPAGEIRGQIDHP